MAIKPRQADTTALHKEWIQIDKHALDDELETHSMHYLEIQEEHIKAVSKRDAYKVATEETYAEESERIRAEFEATKERYTEQRIKEQIAVSKAYLDTVATYQEAKTQADMLGALVQAFDQRGRMLSKLVDLYIAGYWSNTSIKGAKSTVTDARAKEARASYNRRG